MKPSAIQKAIKDYDYTPRQKKIAHLLPVRDKFVAYFNEDFIRQMKVDDYCIGKGIKDWRVFSYAIERTFHDLGSIVGATSYKFGIFYSPGDKGYKWVKRFGDTKTKAFNQVKRSILDLLKYGEKGDIDGIAGNMLSSMVKGKILSLYYPEKYLNIFSDAHLDAYLIKLGLDSEELLVSKPVYKRQRLVEFKNNDPIMREWEMDKFSDFLYNKLPMTSDSDNVEEDDETDYNTGTVTYEVESKTVEADLLHKRMQVAIKDILLKEGYLYVYLEKDHVDIKAFTTDGKKHFFEVKTVDAKETIRESIGQLLEYSHYPTTNRAEKLFIIGPQEPDEKDRAYLQLLREKYKLPIWFRWYESKENKLNEPV